MEATSANCCLDAAEIKQQSTDRGSNVTQPVLHVGHFQISRLPAEATQRIEQKYASVFERIDTVVAVTKKCPFPTN